MFRLTGFACIALACALLPLLPAPATPAARPFAGWPVTFDGMPLVPVSLTPLEKRFATEFPGQIARFSQPGRCVVMRLVNIPTRALHPLRDCYVASGFSIIDRPLLTDTEGRIWQTFTARRGNLCLRVRERIIDSRQGAWTDVSAWYWSASLGESTGPWLAINIIDTDVETEMVVR